MKVLFTHSYFLRFDAKQWELQQPYAPLGTMYAAAVLRRAGIEVPKGLLSFVYIRQ